MSEPKIAGLVYSSEHGRMCPECSQPIATCVCKKAGLVPPVGDGFVRIRLETKGRGGKAVTTIKGAPGDLPALEALTKELKRRCGTGGTLKNFIIEIQGDHRDTIANYLELKGVPVRKS